MRRLPDPLPPNKIRALCSECDGEGKITCEACHGDGDRPCECDSCGHEHDRECHECDGDGVWTCETCFGFGCTEAAQEWAREKVFSHVPTEVLRLLVRIAPDLDAGGVPRFGVRCDDCGASPVVSVEIRRDATGLRRQLAACGFVRRGTCLRPREHMEQWSWIGAGVALSDRRAP